MSTKPNIILLHDLIDPFEEAVQELFLIEDIIKNNDDNIMCKSLYLYIYAILESTLSLSYKKILYAFPEKLNVEIIDFKKYKKDIIENSLSHKLIEKITTNFSQKLSYGKIREKLKDFSNTFQISESKAYYGDLEKIKQNRNRITHRLTAQYILSKEDLLCSLNVVKGLLEDYKSSIFIKYKDYTPINLIKNSWNYIFNAPLLSFDSHWRVETTGCLYYNINNIEKIGNCLSSSERTFLILFISNYSDVLKDFYSLSDIALHASISDKNKIAFMTELFERYPLLLQNTYQNHDAYSS